jgi:ribulose-phosphate 3-epimerase
MITICPSILSADFLNLQTEIECFTPCSNLWFHIDIMDGHFVPNLTFGKTVLKNLSKVTTHKLDAHFMVTNPEFFVEDCKDLGLHNFTFHWEATNHHDRLISEVKKYYPSVGISLNPSTHFNVIPNYLLKNIDLILIMSVNPGFGGQSFIPGVLEKIEYFNKIKETINPNLVIQVDGGVTNLNAKTLTSAGATHLVAGSYIFSASNKDYINKINSLR